MQVMLLADAIEQWARTNRVDLDDDERTRLRKIWSTIRVDPAGSIDVLTMTAAEGRQAIRLFSDSDTPEVASMLNRIVSWARVEAGVDEADPEPTLGSSPGAPGTAPESDEAEPKPKPDPASAFQQLRLMTEDADAGERTESDTVPATEDADATPEWFASAYETRDDSSDEDVPWDDDPFDDDVAAFDEERVDVAVDGDHDDEADDGFVDADDDDEAGDGFVDVDDDDEAGDGFVDADADADADADDDDEADDGFVDDDPGRFVGSAEAFARADAAARRRTAPAASGPPPMAGTPVGPMRAPFWLAALLIVALLAVAGAAILYFAA